MDFINRAALFYQMNKKLCIFFAIAVVFFTILFSIAVAYERSLAKAKDCTPFGKYTTINNKPTQQFLCGDGKIRWLELNLDIDYADTPD